MVDKVHATVKAALADPTVKRRIEGIGSIVVGNTPDEFQKQVKDESNTYKGVVFLQKLKLA